MGTSSTSNSNDRKTYKCDKCRRPYSNGAALAAHKCGKFDSEYKTKKK